jgi:hypothetical protein
VPGGVVLRLRRARGGVGLLRQGLLQQRW